MTLRAPSGLPELARPRGIWLEEWHAVRDAADALVTDAQQRLHASGERYTRTRSPTARAELARATRGHRAALRARLAVRVLWDTGARGHEVCGIRLDEIERRTDGNAVLPVRGKGRCECCHGHATGPCASCRGPCAPCMGSGKIVRDVAMSALTTRLIDEWLQHAPESPFLLPGRDPTRPLTVDGLDKIVHELALRARVQKYLPGGRDRRQTHKFLITAKALRERAERVSSAVTGKGVAARVHGHSEDVQNRHYLRAGAEEALAVTLARADG